MTKHTDTYYWACECCGAAPIAAGPEQRPWFATQEEAQAAGIPARCPNVYCHSNPGSPHHRTQEGGWYRIHHIREGK